MKLVIYQPGGESIEIEAHRVRVMCGLDHFELREQAQSVLVRLEEHDGGLSSDLAIFPNGGNTVRLKGGLR